MWVYAVGFGIAILGAVLGAIAKARASGAKRTLTEAGAEEISHEVVVARTRTVVAAIGTIFAPLAIVLGLSVAGTDQDVLALAAGVSVFCFSVALVYFGARYWTLKE